MKMNLLTKKELIDGNPMHIATISGDKPNISIAADVKVIEDNIILIAHNEMVNTPKNILVNNNVVLTTFNENWEGLRIFGTADYYTEGEYFDKVNELFKNENTTPKGAIKITVHSVEEVK